jgi:PAS domain S-box-containing protein
VRRSGAVLDQNENNAGTAAAVGALGNGPSEIVTGGRLALSIGMDISKRKRMEVLLAESEARYQAILTAVPVAVLLIRGGRFLYANPRALELTGFETPEQIIGLPAEELIAAQDLAMVRERVQRCESGQGNTPTEIHVLHRDGSQSVMATISVPIRLEDGPATLVMEGISGASGRNAPGWR